MTTRNLKLDQIRIDGDTQSRDSLDAGRVEQYAEAMSAGEKFPPITVFHDGRHYWLADGFHRYHATRRTGTPLIAAEVVSGTLTEAQDHADQANVQHDKAGLPRTNSDKRRAVTRLLGRHPDWSDRRVAEHASVSHTSVANIRAALAPAAAPAPAKRVGRDGVARTKSAPPPPRSSSQKPEPVASDATEAAVDVPDTSPFTDLISRIKGIRRDVATLAAEWAGTHLRHQQIETDLCNAMNSIKFAVPYKPCPNKPNCVNGCKLCHGSEFVPAAIWNLIPEDER
jgi:hypothetical protein